ncbi:MAG: hypothetical protein VKJ87_00640 [Synechococcus sp.]|nr:hypothetical protein [Synechococcus sp.]
MSHDADYREAWADDDSAAPRDEERHSSTFTEAGVVRFNDYYDSRDEDER